jgi:DNA-binding MarR family transcriptional regulator
VKRTPAVARPRNDAVDETRAVLDALRRIVRTLRTNGSSSSRESAAGLFVLQTLADGGTLSVNEIAARTHTHQSSASVVVNRLVRRKLVRRARSADDGRRVEMTLAPQGVEFLKRAPRAPQERLVAGVHLLDPTERARLAASLGALVRAMRIHADEPSMFFEDGAARPSVRRSRSARS